jgi:hypothetical protein
LIALNRCNQVRFAPVFLLLANFRTIKYDSTYTKDFSWKIWPKFARFWRITFSNFQKFTISSSRQSRM